MNYATSLKSITEKVVEGIITSSSLSNDILGSNFGFKIKELSRSRFDRRNSYLKEGIGWHFGNEDLSWGVDFGIGYSKHQIDITTDGKYLCYRYTFVDYIFYEVELLTDEEVEDLKEKIRLDEIERNRIKQLVERLTQVLVNEMYPYSKLFTGELEIKHGIHLKQIQRAEHRFMRYVPQHGKEEWVANRVLCWGSNTGWDITRDGKIACCRVNYDDYINFEIETLTAEQIEEYKSKFGGNVDKPLVDRLSTLKEIFERGLITEEVFMQKKEAILSEL